MNDHVSLDRQFSLVPKNQEEVESDDILADWNRDKPKTWDDMDHEFRCVILAEAGAGKTEELKQRAKVLEKQGKPVFFIRIEDIETDFYKAFEVGEEDKFQAWLQSMDDAWFFLDSVDEARLENPRTFEKALRLFAKNIKKSAHRAHIYLSSRPYAWRPKEDRILLDEILFFKAPQEGKDNEKNLHTKPQSTLSIYTMRHLDENRIQRFCQARKVNNTDLLLNEIERTNLWNLAERPFDLEGILAKWEKDNALGSRLTLLRHNIDKRLRDDHNSNRSQRQLLNLEQAKEGARRLAAAVVLTGEAGFNVPDNAQDRPGIEAESVLSDWNPKDVRALLERGIFNDIIYGAVRFRHRDIRELLAAEWFDGLLQLGNSRYQIEKLFFCEQYGQKIITPRLRPVLSWLILLDKDIRRRALDICPEIAAEGGDLSQLPLKERQNILGNIVQRIVSDEDRHSARGNSAITRIANLDLSKDTLQLINEYYNNNDAIFFLGRLVWQGNMTSCVTPLVEIAVDSSRGIYARIASARAVMTCGSTNQKQSLWQKINEDDILIPREILAELVQEMEPDSSNIAQLIISLGKLKPYDRYKGSGLGRALHTFIERLSIDSNQDEIIKLLEGLSSYLNKQPYVKQMECHVSKEYAWLLSPTIHVVEKLVSAQSIVATDVTALSILLKEPTLRLWSHNNYSEYKGNLKNLIPCWPELNDKLYWASIDRARFIKEEKLGQPLTDDFSVSRLGHYWVFDIESLSRLLDYIGSRQIHDDRLVALSTAFQVYEKEGESAHILTKLQKVVADDHLLKDRLDILLNPPVSNEIRIYEENNAEYQRQNDEKIEREKQNRETWINKLRANPDRICNSPNLNPGTFTNDQYWLMSELQDDRLSTGRSGYGNWQMLICDFGEAVAKAYRDAAINHWRLYELTLRSEGDQSNITPYSLLFAMTGLEIEAAESVDFPSNLNKAEARHALRYVTKGHNGFPSWFERMYQVFPILVEEAVTKELFWELESTSSDEPIHYILQEVVNSAPWLHRPMAPLMLDWMEGNPERININRHHCLHIMINGAIDSNRLSLLANRQITQSKKFDSTSWWYALYVDCDPTNGIPKIEEWLLGLEADTATRAAQIFITSLMGGRTLRKSGPNIGNFRVAEHLKRLYILMHKYIPVNGDINRAGGSAYTPELRDDAQDARNGLFNLLSKKPGKENYTVIKQLIQEHPNSDSRSWMAREAYKRAEEDGDLKPWTAEQVGEFAISQTITPATHQQLFDLAVYRLFDLKKWLEYGNDSAWQTWRRAENETEMRTLIAGWLGQQSHKHYTTVQESELANSQRMDICLQNTAIDSPVPIELKLLDKNWSGPKLCERLRNQLVGDYLREEDAKYGIMLLVWQGNKPEKRWVINDKYVSLNELAEALKFYWQSIADDFTGIDEIDVVVIDLSIRAQVCDS